MPKEVFGPDYAFLKKSEWLRFTELDAIVSAFVQLGVRKIRLTGGEPLLRPGLNKYIHGLKHVHQIDDVALTTNGLRLAERAGELRQAGLDRVTVSLDALDPRLAGQMNGLGIAPDAVLAGIAAAQQEGFEVKVNMVVERGANEAEVLPMARYFKECGVTLRFIEFMDVGNHNGWKLGKVVPGREILQTIEREFEVEPVDLSSSAEVAKRYRYKDGSAEFGLITSVSQPFCGGCTRARISADGKLYTCLFAAAGFNLKAILRGENYDKDSLCEILKEIWQKRDDRYSELRSAQTPSGKKVEMSYIGG